MAQKTFKIGLSDTDKQNMAQDVYERLINMCFDTYNSANTYNEGDFVVYENPSDTFKLYKCLEDNVTGAWDSTKWQLATFQDLVDDIEGAVAFVNDKANIDGNYPTMTVGFADNLTPYDDESGDDQDEPFSFQATGTGNGSQADFATGSAALLKEKQGNTVVVNQQFTPTSTTTNNGITFTNNGDGSVTASGIANGEATFSLNGNGNPHIIVGHKYLSFGSPSGADASTYGIFVSDEGVKNNTIFTGGETGDRYSAIYVENGVDLTTPITFRPILIDLTQWFGDNIPAHLLAHPEDFFRYYQGSLAYNEGTLVNSNGRYIKCIGRQQWDEQWELGAYYTDTGTKSASNDRIRNKNLIRVISGNSYYFKSPSNLRVLCYDKDGNYLRFFDWIKDDNLELPSNCCFINFYLVDAYGTTYNHDVTISIYYEGESGYDQYYPYEELANIDTGTEVLRSAGNAKDSKAPDNTITRRVGVVDLGSLSWNYNAQYGMFSSSPLANIKAPSSNSIKANIVCSIRQAASNDTLYVAGINANYIAISNDGYITINTTETNAATFKTAVSGVYLFYELATPTTEQGTSFSANLSIDDFGSMDFGGSNGVPQGALIFYPVDYKAFVDTLYDYAEGTPSSLAKKTDLPTAPQTWAESLPGYDATKTQTLKNVQGALTWVDDE